MKIDIRFFFILIYFERWRRKIIKYIWINDYFIKHFIFLEDFRWFLLPYTDPMIHVDPDLDPDLGKWNGSGSATWLQL